MRLEPRAVFLVLGLATPALATEPGTPMECSDLELAPGLSCTALSEPGAGSFNLPSAGVVDNEGRILSRADGSVFDLLEVVGSCGATDLAREALLYENGADGARTPLATVRWRCLDAVTQRVESMRFANVVFHAASGSLLVAVSSRCLGAAAGSCPGYASAIWTARIDGFKPLADVLPRPSPLWSNGLDDDGDSRVDADDPQCKSDADNDESRP